MVCLWVFKKGSLKGSTKMFYKGFVNTASKKGVSISRSLVGFGIFGLEFERF